MLNYLVFTEDGVVAKSIEVTLTAEMVTLAAASVKDAAGAVKNLAENLLRAISPDSVLNASERHSSQGPALNRNRKVLFVLSSHDSDLNA